MTDMKRMRGFTLIELMIAVAIVAILATIVYPSYQDSIRKSRRADAITSLLAVQQAQEKWRANNTTYGTATQIGTSGTSPGGYYTVVISGQSATAYTATATATGAQAGDSACATIVLNQDGPDKSDSAKKTCWGG